MLQTDSTIYWVLEKSKETILEFIMVEYSKINCKLTSVQLNKLKNLLNLMKEQH